MSFTFKKLAVPDILVVEPAVFKDDRGFFAELYKLPEFEKNGIAKSWLQVNCSKSGKNVLRGLHYQKEPMAQAKLIRVTNGKIFDVIVDIRKGSPFYGKSVTIELSSDDLKLVYIPEGFAHGFCSLSAVAEVTYYTSNVYSPQHEKGICWNDPKLKINWPTKNPVVSPKDAQLPSFDLADNNFVYAKK